MAGKWSTGRLGDCVLLQSGGTPSKSRPDFWTGNVPWVSAKDMKSYWIEDTEDHLSETGVNEATRIVEKRTTLLLVRGMTLHNDVPICRVRRPSAFNQDVKAVLARAGTDPEFVPYLLLGNKDKLLSIVDSAGHGTGRLNSDTLLNLPVHIPPDREQRAIAHILGTLDDKIELNRRMNETLEAMVRTLFKSWFVDFDPIHAKMEGRDPGLPKSIADLFPDRFEDSELGEIPAGWGAGTVGEFVTLSRDSINPGEFPDEEFDHFSIPAFDEGQRPKSELGSTIKSNKFLVSQDAVLLSKLNPRIPRIWFPVVRDKYRAICSTEFLVTRSRTSVTREFLYSFLSSEDFADIFETLVTGTSGSHQRVKPEGLLVMNAVIPSKPVIHQFTKVVQPLLARMNHARDESATLAALRDTLLPKLISGELRVKDTEEMTEEI